MLIGIGGKSNTGKTTFFSAATLIQAEISNRIFTTIKPNRGIGWVQKPCPCQKLGVKCEPRNSKCIQGIRHIPVQLLDVAGLVPGAHEGRGLGNQFLDELMDSDVIIHVIDLSGGTDQDGNPVQPGTRDPQEDIRAFELELDYWLLSLLERGWDQVEKQVRHQGKRLEAVLAERFSGLKISREAVKQAIEKTGFGLEGDKMEFVRELRRIAKPILVAGNKADLPQAKKNLKPGIIPVSAEAELTLRKAADAGFISYLPGSKDFEILKPLSPEQERALEYIRENVLKPFGSTGVQECLNKAVFDLLGYRVVYPVANLGKLSDKEGRILPDAFLVKPGTRLKEFAYQIHTELGERFLGGIGLDRKRLSADYELQDGDIIEILVR